MDPCPPKEFPVAKTAAECPMQATAVPALRPSQAPANDRAACPDEDELPAMFLADLAERIADLCVPPQRSRPDAADRAIPSPAEAAPQGDGFHVSGAIVPMAESGAVALYRADGHLRPLRDIEADIIRLAVSHYHGRLSEVARRLSIGRSTLYRKVDEFGIGY